MDSGKVKDYWLEEAEEALLVASHLFEKKDYSYALFFGHLALEKLLKALYVVQRGEQAPYLHDLCRLAEGAHLSLTEPQKRDLTRITAFNLESRYPDPKRSFRRKCSEQFTENELKRIKEIFTWLKSMLP